jgi:hypothetical protein
VDGECRRVSAAEGSAAGWFSPAYGVRIASICVKVERDLGETREMRVEVGRS